MRMTKAQVLADFRELWADAIKHDPNLKGDSIAKREAFNDYTDSLCKDRRISSHQYNTWTNPF